MHRFNEARVEDKFTKFRWYSGAERTRGYYPWFHAGSPINFD